MHGTFRDKRIRDVESSRLFRERRKSIFQNFSKIFKMVTKRVSLYRISKINNTRGVFFDEYLELIFIEI